MEPFIAPKDRDTMLQDGKVAYISTQHQCITAMASYENMSLEELRLLDYTKSNKSHCPVPIFFNCGEKQIVTQGPFGINIQVRCPRMRPFECDMKQYTTNPLFGQPGVFNTHCHTTRTTPMNTHWDEPHSNVHMSLEKSETNDISTPGSLSLRETFGMSPKALSGFNYSHPQTTHEQETANAPSVVMNSTPADGVSLNATSSLSSTTVSSSDIYRSGNRNSLPTYIDGTPAGVVQPSNTTPTSLKSGGSASLTSTSGKTDSCLSFGKSGSDLFSFRRPVQRRTALVPTNEPTLTNNIVDKVNNASMYQKAPPGTERIGPEMPKLMMTPGISLSSPETTRRIDHDIFADTAPKSVTIAQNHSKQVSESRSREPTANVTTDASPDAFIELSQDVCEMNSALVKLQSLVGTNVTHHDVPRNIDDGTGTAAATSVSFYSKASPTETEGECTVSPLNLRNTGTNSYDRCINEGKPATSDIGTSVKPIDGLEKLVTAWSLEEPGSDPTTTTNKMESVLMFHGLSEFSFCREPNLKKAKSSTGGTLDEESILLHHGNEDSHKYFDPVVTLPNNLELKTGEEDEDLVYCQRAKLFRFNDNRWKERGVGNLKILRSKYSGKVRVLMRREHVLKVCMNHNLTMHAVLHVPCNADGRAWMWHAMDFADEEQMHQQFAVRFHSKEAASNFKTYFDTARDSPASLPGITNTHGGIAEETVESEERRN